MKTRRLCFIAAVACALGAASDAAQPPVCVSIKNAALKGRLAQYAIPFDQAQPGELSYASDLDGDGAGDRLGASCGNGIDAVCELHLTTGRGSSFEFSLPASMRVMQIRGRTFIVTGLVLHQTGRIELNDYAVHELHRDRLKRVCDKF